VDTTVDDGIIIKCLKKDPAKNEEEALKDIYRRLRPGDPPTAANARALIKRLFFDAKRYDLGRVGRYKINQKLGIKGGDSRILTKEDLVAATKYLLRLKKGEGSWTTLTISAAAASAPWANCWPTSAASAWPAPNAWSRSA
jgi:DNA-directed RNA polymerase subunit beta